MIKKKELWNFVFSSKIMSFLKAYTWMSSHEITFVNHMIGNLPGCIIFWWHRLHKGNLRPVFSWRRGGQKTFLASVESQLPWAENNSCYKVVQSGLVYPWTLLSHTTWYNFLILKSFNQLQWIFNWRLTWCMQIVWSTS